MNQPCADEYCDIEWVAYLGPPEPVPAPQTYEVLQSRDLAAAWMILGLIVAVAIFEIWALLKRKDTISQLIQHISKGRAWFKALGIIGLAVLGWHILWGFPWKLGKKD